MYIDQAGTLPHMSFDGVQYFFIVSNYNTNYIYALLIKNLKDETIISVFEEVINDLKAKGHTPTFNITDKQATKPTKASLKT